MEDTKALFLRKRSLTPWRNDGKKGSLGKYAIMGRFLSWQLLGTSVKVLGISDHEERFRRDGTAQGGAWENEGR